MLARSAFCRAVASAAGGARVVARKFHFSAPSAAFAIRKPAPSWSCDAYMPDGGFTTLSSKDFEGSWTVLNFYPLDFTFNCPTEITSLSDRAKEFEDLGVKVAVVSTDSKFSHYHWSHQPRNKGGVGKLNIPMISDLSRKMSREFGVLNDDESDPDCGVAFRGTFIIDPHGTVRSVQINDLPVSRSVDEILRLVQAFLHVEKHGEVCPANWKPGHATIKPDVHQSQEFFGKLA